MHGDEPEESQGAIPEKGGIMKLSELKPCAACHGKIAPIWYVVRISQAMLNPRAANQTLGLAQMFGGNLALAEVMSPQPDCVLVMGDAEPGLMTELSICQNCFLMGKVELPILMEEANH